MSCSSRGALTITGALVLLVYALVEAPDVGWGDVPSGLSNTALQIGGALGVAIVSTVAVSSSERSLAANEGANQLVVLNEGFQSAFLAVVVLAGIGMALALLLPGRPRTARPQHLDPAPATSAGD